MSTFGISGCKDCVMFRECGGHPLEMVYEVGCVNYANSAAVDTDDMNPLFQERFWQLWKDVNGLHSRKFGRLSGMSAEGLPSYIPLLQHKNMNRSRALDVPIVALKLFDLLKKPHRGIYAPRFTSPQTLRTGYKLRQDTKIILTGVDVDGPLETFWSEHRVSGVCEALAGLDITGLTVPNYSFFTCGPRFQILRNRKRILLASERLSEAGVPVSLHIHGNTPYDWDFFLNFLKDHSELSTVTLEFQSGPRLSEAVARETFNFILRIRDCLGRKLHPIVLGAARLYQDFSQEFPDSFTLIDSQPFMQAIHRKMLVKDSTGKFFYEDRPTEKGAPLDDLIESNIILYPEKLAYGMSDEPHVPARFSKQREFSWLTSIPNFTAQPVARDVSAMNAGATL